MQSVYKLCTVSTSMHSVYRLYSGKRAYAQCPPTMHSVYKLCTGSTCMHSVYRLYVSTYTYTRIRSVYEVYTYTRIHIRVYTYISEVVNAHDSMWTTGKVAIPSEVVNDLMSNGGGLFRSPFVSFSSRSRPPPFPHQAWLELIGVKQT